MKNSIVPARIGRGDDRGIALISAVIVVIVSSTLVAVAIGLATNATKASSRDRDRSVAITAAESGVDHALGAMVKADGGLPCRWPLTGTASTQSAPRNGSYVATITYYAMNGVGIREELPCAGGYLNPSLVPSEAVVTSTGTAVLPGTEPQTSRTMQAGVRLQKLDSLAEPNRKALFVKQDADVGDGLKVGVAHGDGLPADVYVGRDFICQYRAWVDGTFYVGRDVRMADCEPSVGGDLLAGRHIYVASVERHSKVNGMVRSSLGSVTFGPEWGFFVGTVVEASGDTENCDSLMGGSSQCYPDSQGLPEFPDQPFPS